MPSQFSFRKIHSLQQLRSVLSKDTTIENPLTQKIPHLPLKKGSLLNASTNQRKPSRVTASRGTPNRQEAQFIEFLAQQGWTFIAYEAVRIRLAHQCWYTPDILAWKPKEKITFFEVKGFWEDDARVKVKVAAGLLSKHFSIKTARHLQRKWQIKTVTDTGPKPATLPGIELLHPQTGNYQLSVPISKIRSDPTTGQLEISVTADHLENALYRYLLFLETGKMPSQTLSRPKKKAAQQILAHSNHHAIDTFRAHWEELAFARFSHHSPSPVERLNLL